MLSSSESSRRRKKDPDRERTSPKSKDKERDRDRDEKKERHKSSKSSSSVRKSRSSISKTDERERERERRRSREPSSRERKERSRTPSSTSQTPPRPQRMAIVPEMERRGSLGSPHNGSRSSLSSYPTLSKTHAKENIYSRNGGNERAKSPTTPEATDVGDSQDREKRPSVPAPPLRTPPSPPLTATTGADLRKTASANSIKKQKAESLHKEMEPGRRSVDSGTHLTPDSRFSASRSSMREDLDVDETDLTSTTGSSQPSTVRMTDKPSPAALKTKARSSRPADSRTTPLAPPAPRPHSTAESEITQSSNSESTTMAQGHEGARRQREVMQVPIHRGGSPASVIDSSPRTPTQHAAMPSVLSVQKDGPSPVEVLVDPISRTQSVNSTYTDGGMPPPPPPPPPEMVVMTPPRVDYLLMNGGLPRPTTRSLLGGANGQPATAYNAYASPRVGASLDYEAKAFFQPLQQVLDSYSAVIDKSGSVAVATGYRSVARRLLDRLEAVFARNISSEQCDCIMCREQYHPASSEDSESHGINWGEVLEFVSGRRDLPTWPPFSPTSTGGLGISDLEDPCQRIDIDVPEEYRKFYTKQSEKTKASVQDWLSGQQDVSAEDADDDTLTFAMLTRLEQAHRPLFYALLYGMDHIPNPRSQPATTTGTAPAISKAAMALQRLYRLSLPPRDQLVVMYLIQNPQMHTTLATLAAVKRQEWEILISGRFDGFLWSGAEDLDLGFPMPPSGIPTRNSGPADADGPQRFASPLGARPFTPYAPSPSPRPGSTRLNSGPAPVQVDEDTEIAVLAEVERDIFLAMESLENAFEDLHNQAEQVRRRLRDRYSALSAASQTRSHLGGIEVRGATPGPSRPDLDAEAIDDLRSEIGPDDSASNVSHNRRGRGHRSKARRTPAPVEEETEEQIASLAERIRRKF
jgi:hypothetical protein